MGHGEDLRKLLYSVLTVFVVAISLGVYSNVRQNANTARTDKVVCGIVQESALDAANRLAAYADEPPATLAGQAQRDAVADALSRWNDRAATLGCND